MTLLERIVALRKQAERHQQLDLREDLARRLRERTGELERHAAAIEDARARLATLAAIAPPRAIPKVATFVRVSEGYHAIVAAMDPKLGTPQDDGTATWAPLQHAGKTFLDKLDTLVKEAVGDYKTTTLSVMSATDIEALRHVPGAEISATTLTALRYEISTANWLSGSPTHLKQLLEKAAAFKEKADSLRAKNIPDAVKEFFQEARAHAGAPYKKLTEEVLAWLGDSNQLERLRVVLR